MNLNDLKMLTTEQYDKCRETALERVKSRIGEKPQRVNFERELGQLWTVLDILAMVIFLAALLISSLHIRDYVTNAIGSRQGVYTLINQWGYIALAESSMVLFMVLHGMTAKQRRARVWYLRPASIHLLLALVAGLFIFTANIASGIGILLSVMPPLFTTGIAFNLERLIIASIQRRNEINGRYLSAIQDYEAASHDPENHSLFSPFFKQELWTKLISLKPNAPFRDAPPAFKSAAVLREMERERWVEVAPDKSIEVIPVEKPEAKSTPNPFGSTAPGWERGDHESTLMSVNGNGNGYVANGKV